MQSSNTSSDNVTVVFNAYHREDLSRSSTMLEKFAKRHDIIIKKTKIKSGQRQECIEAIHGCDGKGLIHSVFNVFGSKRDLIKLSETNVKDGALMYIFPNT